MRHQPQPQPRFWRPSQVARITNLSTSTVRRAIASGRLPAVRIDRAVLVSDEALRRFIESAEPVVGLAS